MDKQQIQQDLVFIAQVCSLAPLPLEQHILVSKKLEAIKSQLLPQEPPKEEPASK